MHQRGQPKQETGVSSSPKHSMAKPSLLSRHHHLALIAFVFLSLAALSALITRSFPLCASLALLPTLLEEPSLSQPNGLELIRGKTVVLVSHELSLSGGPLLLMELAVLLKRAGGDVKWVTNQKDAEKTMISQNLEAKLLKNVILRTCRLCVSLDNPGFWR
ncbi:hypothetical protein L7F22_032199 [Adiantum nelumboides]|nr:hypothetical protein [Adiantum nelumboides]